MARLQWQPVQAPSADPNQAMANAVAANESSSRIMNQLRQTEIAENAALMDGYSKLNAGYDRMLGQDVEVNKFNLELEKHREKASDNYGSTMNYIQSVLTNEGKNVSELMTNPELVQALGLNKKHIYEGAMQVQEKHISNMLSNLDAAYEATNAQFAQEEAEIAQYEQEGMQPEALQVLKERLRYKKENANKQYTTNRSNIQAGRFNLGGSNVGDLSVTGVQQRGAQASGSAASFENPSNSNVTNRVAKDENGYAFLTGNGQTQRVTSEMSGYIDVAAQHLDVPPELIVMFGKQESNFNPDAESETGVIGAMQVTQNSQQEMFDLYPQEIAAMVEEMGGVFNPDLPADQNRRDPRVSIATGTVYIKHLQNKMGTTDPLHTYLAYNVGLEGSKTLREALRDPSVSNSTLVKDVVGKDGWGDWFKNNASLYENKTLGELQEYLSNHAGIASSPVGARKIAEAGNRAQEALKAGDTTQRDAGNVRAAASPSIPIGSFDDGTGNMDEIKSSEFDIAKAGLQPLPPEKMNDGVALREFANKAQDILDTSVQSYPVPEGPNASVNDITSTEGYDSLKYNEADSGYLRGVIGSVGNELKRDDLPKIIAELKNRKASGEHEITAVVQNYVNIRRAEMSRASSIKPHTDGLQRALSEYNAVVKKLDDISEQITREDISQETRDSHNNAYNANLDKAQQLQHEIQTYTGKIELINQYVKSGRQRIIQEEAKLDVAKKKARNDKLATAEKYSSTQIAVRDFGEEIQKAQEHLANLGIPEDHPGHKAYLDNITRMQEAREKAKSDQEKAREVANAARREYDKLKNK